MKTNMSLRTAQAAEVAGVGYEGLRSWLKRGLLRDAGALPKFSTRDAPAEITDLKRWRWSSFGFADLCSFRLAKVMFDAKLSWDFVDPIVRDLWRSHFTDSSNERFLAVFARSTQYTLYSEATLADDFAKDIVRAEWMTLIDLHELRRNVMVRIRMVALRALAEDVEATADISAKSSVALFMPTQSAVREAEIKRIAGDIRALAIEVERGEGSYQNVEMLLGQLHKAGMMADTPLVATLAAAFPDHPGNKTL